MSPPRSRTGSHENLSGDVTLTESRFGEVLVSMTLGVSTSAGARV